MKHERASNKSAESGRGSHRLGLIRSRITCFFRRGGAKMREVIKRKKRNFDIDRLGDRPFWCEMR